MLGLKSVRSIEGMPSTQILKNMQISYVIKFNVKIRMEQSE